MFINNNIANQSYVSYAKNVNNLQKSAERLASGDKFGATGDGAGEVGVSDLLRLEISGSGAIASSMENAIGYADTQDAILSQVSDIADRMNELATSAVDPMKTTEERAALNSEFTALSTEVSELAANSKYNGTDLFDDDMTVRTGTESTEIVTFASISLSLLTFGSLDVTTTGNASIAMSTIKTRIGSLAALRSTARTNGARIERSLEFTNDYTANLENVEAAVRNVDIAKEAAEFSKAQVAVSAAQSVLAQANNFPQNIQRLLP